jgi:hypothetical protein
MKRIDIILWILKWTVFYTCLMAIMAFLTVVLVKFIKHLF